MQQNDAATIAPSNAQLASSYTITGKVVDKETQQPVSFTTVFFPYSPVGSLTEADGSFILQFDEWPHDTLKAQILGYKTARVMVKKMPKQNVVIELEPNAAALDEVVITAGEDPALILLKRIIDRKPYNNPDKSDNYSYEAYNKLEIDLLNLTREQFEMLPIPYIKKFGFIYDNRDTITGPQPFLPFFLVETLSDYYYQKEPKRSREIIKANQIRGINNQSITKYMGKMHLVINPYDNFILFFDKQFVSPISNAGAVFYKYRLLDTQMVEGRRVIEMSFAPQRLGENCFSGSIKVVDSVFALQYIKGVLPKSANLNWIKDAVFWQQYVPVDSLWFCEKENLTAELVVSPDIKLPGLIGRKTTSYRNIRFNDPSIPRTIARMKEQVRTMDTARNKGEEFWATARHEVLSKNERSIYNMFDTLEANATYNRFKNLMRVLFTGVIQTGPVEWGPYWSIYSNNIIEGNRFRFSMGTTPKFSKDLYMNGYVAYGTKDGKFKYSLSALWIPERNPRTYLFASYTSDIDRRTNYYDRVSFDNIFNLAIRRPNIPFKFIFTKEARFEFFKSYHSGFSHNITAMNKQFDPYDPLPSVSIFKDQTGSAVNSITKTEVDLQLRFAYKERFLEGNYYRVSLGSKYPIVDMHYAVGIKGLLNGGYDYHKVTLTVSDQIKIAPLGSLYVNLFGGKYFGTLPYLLLENHPGNESYAYNKYAFNMMTNFEFLSDQYAGANIEHSIGGGVFKYIPLIKKLKFRQFWTAKGVIGSLDSANSALNLNKGYAFRTLEKSPYIELGTGVENILRVFRIDFVWRVLPLSTPAEPKTKYFGIFGSFKINF